MNAILLTLAVTTLLQQKPPAPPTPPPAEDNWRTSGSGTFGEITFGEAPAGTPAAVVEPPAEPAPVTTTWEGANHACRGQTWRRPSETVLACTERLVSTDALSQPLPEGRSPTEPRCRRESVQREDGTGFSVSVMCHETTVVPASPR